MLHPNLQKSINFFAKSNFFRMTLYVIFAILFSTPSLAQLTDIYSCSSNNQQQTIITGNTCRTNVNGSLNNSVEDLLNTSPISDARTISKARGIYISGSVNREGGFYTPFEYQTQPTTKYAPDPNQEGAIFALDINGLYGNDCYEREEELFQNIVNNGFTEIYIYNVGQILKHGDQVVPHFNSGLFVNNPSDILTNEQHLARFITKAKKVHNLKVYGVVSDVLENPDTKLYNRYYRFRNNFDTETLPSNISDINPFCDKYFLQQYAERESAKKEGELFPDYFDENEITTYYSKDDLNRISTFDKALLDIANVFVFNERVSNGALESTLSLTCGEIDENNCNAVFDGLVTEWEWWNLTNNADERLEEYLHLLAMMHCLNNQSYSDCPFEVIAYQGWFENSSWSPNSYSTQQRADFVDQLADKVFLISYKKNACATYEDATSTNTPKQFSERASLFANNGYGALTGNATEIYPLFSSERCVIPEKNLKCPSLPGLPSNEKCDYYSNYSGAFIKDYSAFYSQNIKIGIVEQIFQSQYDFDAVRTASPNSDTKIEGYGWFKSNTMFTPLNSYYGKMALQSSTISDKLLILKAYPNPSKGDIWIDGYEQGLYFAIFNNTGQVILEKQKLISNKLSLSALDGGLYYITLFDEKNNSYKTIKIIIE